MRTDRQVVLIVVITLAIVVVGALVSEVALTVMHRAVPGVISHAFDIGLGALATLLAHTSTPSEDLRALAAATPTDEASAPKAG